MRNPTILINERDFVNVIAGHLFEMAPNRQPRKAEIIIQKARDSFRAQSYNRNEWYSLEVEQDKFRGWIRDLLMTIPEFQELNLTQIEYEKGVSVDDESRPPFAITTAYDKYNSESWKSDFIDLEAFVQNVTYDYCRKKDNDDDCFMCVHDKDNKVGICDTCSVNPNLKNRYEGSRKPKGKYTFACKYNCPESKYICCEECNKKENCANKCDSSSAECGQAIHRKGVTG